MGRLSVIRAAALVLVTALVVVAAYVVPRPQNGAKPALHCAPVAAAWYVPPPSMFGQYNVSSIIHSYSGNEANLIGGNYPADDLDYMHPYQNQRVKLPGDRRDRYYYLGAQYIQGSGWAQEYAAPTGARFAFLHMLTLPGATPPEASQPNQGKSRTCRDQTADAFVAITAPTIATISGGSYVGYSGYPTWAIYGNGSYGEADAHLCVVVSSEAVAWFYHVATRGPIPRPKPRFPAKRWGSHVNAYYRHHLTRTALFFWHRTRQKTALRQSYHRGKPGYHRTTFATRRAILCWDTGHCKVGR